MQLPPWARCLGVLDLVIDYDRRVWPTEYARYHYHRSERWRHVIDAAVADRVMAGDDAGLDAHLRAFAPVGEELCGFLRALVTRADDRAKAARLLELWPRILDRLLPNARDLETRDRERVPYPHDVEELDQTLLLIPPQNSDWPTEDTFRIGARWLAAFKATPHVADRAIMFAGRTLGLRNELAIQIVLAILGDDIRAILRSSSYVVAWLQAVLSDPPTGQATSRARTLLDRLAAAGDAYAIGVQQQLEA